MSEYETTLVPAERCREYWCATRKLLKPAVDRSNGRWALDYILAGLVMEEQYLWMVHKEGELCGVLTCNFSFYPLKKILTIHFLGGNDFEKWFSGTLSVVEKFARGNDCDGIEFNARFGFWKHIKNAGFKKSSMFYEKDI